MTNLAEVTFEDDFFNSFKKWVDIDLNTITWEGRYEKEFQFFWENIFQNGLSLKQLQIRFKFLFQVSKSGPIHRWFKWLEQRFLIFLLKNKNFTLRELSDIYGQSISDVANMLREFLLENYFQKHRQINKNLLISYRTQDAANINFSELINRIDLDVQDLKPGEDSLFRTLEVTLFSDWKTIIDKVNKSYSYKKEDLEKIKNSHKRRTYLKIFLEFTSVLMIGFLLILLVTFVNKFYEKYLLGQINIYSPKLELLDEDIKFQSKTAASKDFELKRDELEDIADKVFDKEKFLGEAPRFEAESEVILTSWDQLPQDIAQADQEISEYEEENKGGYRDTRYGSRKVYRVIMQSVMPKKIREKLVNILDKYEVTTSDKVAPGTEVPGGIYYNLNVPSEMLKEFLSLVTSIEKSRIFESKTRRPNPKGKNKVFIWIKQV